MSTDRDVELIVRSWMDEGVTALPDRVLDAVLDQIPATPQRRSSWLAWRFPLMSNTAVRFGIAAAAVVLVVILGIKFLPGLKVGGPGPTATPTPVQTAIPTSIPTPIPLALNATGALGPDTYRASDSFAFPVTLTIPAGWKVYTVADGYVGIFKPNATDSAASYLIFDVVANVYPDPCQGVPQSPPLGPSVDELVSALTSMVGFQAGAVTDETVGGVSGKAFDVDTSIAASAASCLDIMKIWDTAGTGPGLAMYQSPAAGLRFWIGDVHGTRVAIFINGLEEAAQRDDRQEMQQILDTVRFD